MEEVRSSFPRVSEKPSVGDKGLVSKALFASDLRTGCEFDRKSCRPAWSNTLDL